MLLISSRNSSTTICVERLTKKIFSIKLWSTLVTYLLSHSLSNLGWMLKIWKQCNTKLPYFMSWQIVFKFHLYTDRLHQIIIIWCNLLMLLHQHKYVPVKHDWLTNSYLPECQWIRTQCFFLPLQQSCTVSSDLLEKLSSHNHESAQFGNRGNQTCDMPTWSVK